ncbi:tetratricopeptide repeat protein 17 isoform X2 [Spodoptera frugiperda]|uniref:Tetratricopeptide repeat protein 17 isoform X2 n=1 Tax=Spodoptera frugiperda TaxID=7108 RepID=A0A9R0E9J3_SPOFR|nr:tetratricopeptide repeat protein 17 isoform X2 [Spodoptera frugiperda]
MKFMKLWCLFSFCTIQIQGSTHWMVTEGGLIQPRLDSPFELAKPYDLLAFLNQDTRWENIVNLHYSLSKRQQIIRKLWAELKKNTDVTTIFNENDYCVRAGQLHTVDWYTSSLEEGKTRLGTEEFPVRNLNYGDGDIPDCKRISSLTFSMCAFEHLESMKKRENLSASPETSMPENMSPKNSDISDMSVDQFGHWLAGVLKKNSSSWIHYNMASLYWRVRGNAPKAIECSRRAVHYAPREYKDIPLLSMGLILHRSKVSDDAVIVLGAAVDHDVHCPINHFILANAFAVVGDFNSSVKHYDICLKLNPTFSLADKHRNAVLCNAYFMGKMEIVKDTLSKLREELTKYGERESLWMKSQAALLRTMKQTEEYDYRDANKNFDKIAELTGLNIKDVKAEGDKYSLIQYFLDGPTYNENWLKEKGVMIYDSANSLQRLVKHIGRHVNINTENLPPDEELNMADEEILKEIGPIPTFPDLFPDVIKDYSTNTIIEEELEGVKVEKPIEIEPPKAQIKEKKKESPPAKKAAPVDIEENISEYDTGIILYPTTLKISRNTEDFDTDSEWPTNKQCKDHSDIFPENLEAVYQIFLPFENKGIRLKTLLTDKIGVPANVEHELPWHPPTCPNDKEAATFTQKKSQKPQIFSDVIVTKHLREKLLEYVANGDTESVRTMQDAEVGQRIYSAMQMKLAPKWLLYTLSSLYWRVRGNNVNALHCILTASRTVEPRFKDIVLVSLASIYLEMGYFDEALGAAEEAFKLSLYEPSTNFILAELNMIKKHRNTHMFHLKQVIRVEPGFMGGLARSMLYGWSCLFKQVNVLQDIEFGDGEICTQVEPGMSMVCEKDGTNCHLTNIQCYSAQEKESSTLVRMLELKDDNIQGAPVEEMDDGVFDRFQRDMPKERTDRLAHQKNFEAMMKTVGKELKGCGDRGCANIQAEDLELTEEDCTYQHLELGYWLHIISFRELLSDADPKLPSDILSLTPSNKKTPECRLDVDPSKDFFLERFMRVDSEGWEPVLSLMHQFADVFNYYDYVTLGAKIARYMELHPTSWAGAAVAGWWCGAGGRGGCARRCLAAAHARTPSARPPHAARALTALLHIQNKIKDAKEIAYLSLYTKPKSRIESFLVAVSHTYLSEYEPAVWMYRYSLTFDEKFLPAKACLHATMCLMLFGDAAKAKPKED